MKDYPEDLDDFFLVWKNQNAANILNLLIRKNLTLKELSEELELDLTTVKYHIEKLENFNFVFPLSKSNEGKYSFNKNKMKQYIKFMEHF